MRRTLHCQDTATIGPSHRSRTPHEPGQPRTETPLRGSAVAFERYSHPVRQSSGRATPTTKGGGPDTNAVALDAVFPAEPVAR